VFVNAAMAEPGGRIRNHPAPFKEETSITIVSSPMYVHRRLVILVVGVLVGLALPMHACFGQPSEIQESSRDVQQTMQARVLLAQEPGLAHWNIGVIVRDRVATLWGQIPSAEMGFRAEVCLRSMSDLVEVRNELFVREPLMPGREPPKMDTKPLLSPEQLPPKLPRIPPQPPDPRLLIGAPGILMRHDITQRIQAPEKAIKVLSPPPFIGLPVEDKTVPETAKPSPMTEAEQKLAAVVRALLHSEPTYRDVQFAVQQGRVYLRTANADAESLHEAARAISQLPNVEGVILLDKTSPK
jgi:osmotically-inducible protein OsmY